MNLKRKMMFAAAFLSALPFVSAYTTFTIDSVINSIQNAIYTLEDIAYPIFTALLGDYTGGVEGFSTGEVLFIRVLLLILIYVAINFALSKVPTFEKQRAVIVIISSIVSIISVRYMSQNEFLIGILLPYGTLGITLATLIPFIIYFFFLHALNTGGAGRRLGWIVFGVVFIALFISRFDQLSDLSRYVYLALILAVALSFTFDKGIHRYFFLHELNLFFRGAKSKTAASLQAEYLNIINVNTPEAEKRRKAIEAHLKDIGADIP